MKAIVSFLFFILLCSSINAQSFWAKEFSFYNLLPIDFIEADSSNMVLALEMGDGLGSSIYGIGICKLNSNGDTLWTRFFKNETFSRDWNAIPNYGETHGILQFDRTDSGIVSISSTAVTTIVRKFDKSGIVLWTKEYSASSSASIGASRIFQTADSCFIIFYNESWITHQDDHNACFVIKTNLSGDTLWKRFYVSHYFSDILENPDKSFWVLNYTSLVKMDSLCYIDFYSPGMNRYFFKFAGRISNDVILLGNDYNSNGVICKADSLGHFNSVKVITGISLLDGMLAIDSTIFLLGALHSARDTLILIKLDQNFNLLSETSFTYPGLWVFSQMFNQSNLGLINLLNDSSIIIVASGFAQGHNNINIFNYKTGATSNCILQSTTAYVHLVSDTILPYGAPGYMAQNRLDINNSSSADTIGLSINNACLNVSIETDQIHTSAVKISPNPAFRELKIAGAEDETIVHLFNAQGEKVCSKTIHKGVLFVDDLPAGIYWIHFINQKYRSAKFVKAGL